MNIDEMEITLRLTYCRQVGNIINNRIKTLENEQKRNGCNHNIKYRLKELNKIKKYIDQSFRGE